MKSSIFLLVILFIGGYAKLYSQCTNEKGYYDFPFTQSGITVTGSGTGGYTYYTSAYDGCTIPLKGNSVYIGASASTYTNTFTTAVNDMVYNFGGANVGEIVTVTVNAGTPSVSYTGGDCGSVVQIAGNVISFIEPTPSMGHGGRITIHSTSPFTSVSFSHNGAMAGMLMTMCFDAVFESVKPTVTTTAVSSVTGNSASGGGEVTADGGAAVTARGVCWNTTGTPTEAGSHTTNGTGIGTFTSSITGLSPATTYYVRAYATNSNGTGYGSQLNFTTSSNPAPADPTSISVTSSTICNGFSTQLTANGVDGTVYWYTGSCGTTGYFSSSNPVSVSPVATTTYYARSYNNSQYSAGCASTTITVNQPSYVGTPPTVASLQATGSEIKWYSTSSGGTSLATSVQLVNGNHYYASQTVNGCESTGRMDVTANIDLTPCKPTGSSTQSFASGATVASLAATGTSIRWYADSSGGAALAPSTVLVNGTHYYATQTVSCTESATRFDVTVTIY